MKTLVEMMKKDPRYTLRVVHIISILDRAMGTVMVAGHAEEHFIEALSIFTEARLRKDVDREALRLELMKSHAETSAELKKQMLDLEKGIP